MEDFEKFDLDKLGPDPTNYWLKSKPSKILLIGKPKSGKSFMIKAILYNMRHKINQGIIISGTDDAARLYSDYMRTLTSQDGSGGATSEDTEALSDHFPQQFIYDKYNEEPIRNLIAHQKLLLRNQVKNPWSILIIDDNNFNRKLFTTPLQQELFKNARHWYILYVLSLHNAKDVPPSVRSSADGVFLFREHNVPARKTIYENFGGVVPTYKQFGDLLDSFTYDNGTMWIDNMKSTNDWQDCICYFKARASAVREWMFGAPGFYAHAAARIKDKL